MGINQKFRALDGAAKDASNKADTVMGLAAGVAHRHQALVTRLGLEEVPEPIGEGRVRIRYRRRLPRWLAWVRRLGVWR